MTNLKELTQMDQSFLSTWYKYEEVLLNFLRNQNFSEGLKLVNAIYKDFPVIINESLKIIPYSVALLAHNQDMRRALELIKLAKDSKFHQFYYFDPAWGSNKFKYDDTQKHWIDQGGQPLHKNDPHKIYELHLFLEPIYFNSEIQDYVQKNFSSRVKPWGFDIEKTPLCWFEKTILKRKKDSCISSKKNFLKGEHVLEIRFFNGRNDIPTKPYILDPQLLEQPGPVKNNIEKYSSSSYKLEDFNFKNRFKIPELNLFWSHLSNFSLSKTLQTIAQPKTPPTAFSFSNQYSETENLKIGAGRAAQFIDLLWILIKCGYYNDIKKSLSDLPPHFPLLLLLFDQDQIREEISSYLKMPELVKIYTLLMKTRLTSKEKVLLIEFGREHSEFQQLLGQSLSLYEYHLYSNYFCSPNWFFKDFHYFSRGGGKNFLYLLASDLDLLPAFEMMKQEKKIARRLGTSVIGMGYSNIQKTLYEVILIESEIKQHKDLSFWKNFPYQSTSNEKKYGKTKTQVTSLLKHLK